MNIQKSAMKAQRILESVREFSNMADYEINTQRSITLIHIYVCVYAYIKHMEQFDYLKKIPSSIAVKIRY